MDSNRVTTEYRDTTSTQLLELSVHTLDVTVRSLANARVRLDGALVALVPAVRHGHDVRRGRNVIELHSEGVQPVGLGVEPVGVALADTGDVLDVQRGFRVTTRGEGTNLLRNRDGRHRGFLGKRGWRTHRRFHNNRGDRGHGSAHTKLVRRVRWFRLEFCNRLNDSTGTLGTVQAQQRVQALRCDDVVCASSNLTLGNLVGGGEATEALHEANNTLNGLWQCQGARVEDDVATVFSVLEVMQLSLEQGLYRGN